MKISLVPEKWLKYLQSGHRTHIISHLNLCHSLWDDHPEISKQQPCEAHPAACRSLAASRFWQPSNLKSEGRK